MSATAEGRTVAREEARLVWVAAQVLTPFMVVGRLAALFAISENDGTRAGTRVHANTLTDTTQARQQEGVMRSIQHPFELPPNDEIAERSKDCLARALSFEKTSRSEEMTVPLCFALARLADSRDRDLRLIRQMAA